jgi:hypothetical protein
MLKGRARSAVYAASVLCAIALAMLAWRGMEALEGKELEPSMVWREATSDDLF